MKTDALKPIVDALIFASEMPPHHDRSSMITPAALASITSRNDQRVASVSLTVVGTLVEAANVDSASMLSALSGSSYQKGSNSSSASAIFLAVGRFHIE